jgi:UDP-N-acetylglucosamine 3-dehydrogenase
MGENHLRVLKETPGFELVAVADARATPSSDVGPARLFRTTRELASVDFDAAVVATPTETHHDVVMELIEMRKHVLVEKPIASTFAEGRAMLAAAERAGTQLVVGHVERFNPAVQKLREVLRGGLLGAPIHFAFTRVGGFPETLVAGNNVILDLAVHDIDVLRSLVGPVKLEYSICHATSCDGIFDTAEIVFASGLGASAVVHVNWITPTKIRTIRVTGTRAVCFVDYIRQTCELFGGNLLEPVAPEDASIEPFGEEHRSTDKIQLGVQRVEPLRAQAAQLRALLAGGEQGELCSGRDGLAAVLLAEKAVRVERGSSRSSGARAAESLLAATDEWV